MTTSEVHQWRMSIPEFRDSFPENRRRGAVSGTEIIAGTRRVVIDVEDRVSIDHGALRLAPNRQAGWGREGLVYGPFQRRAGAAFALYVLNGHNGSHSGPIDGGVRRRFVDWALGPRDRSLLRRAADFAGSSRKSESLWLWHWWLRNTPRFSDGVVIEDNLAVGWFDRCEVSDPLEQGSCLVVRTNAGETGRLAATVGDGTAIVVPVVLNVPTYYLVVLGPSSSTYLAASIADVAGFVELPLARPLAVERTVDPPRVVYAGLHQSVLGQVGFSADTRVYGAAAAVVPTWTDWWTTAHLADSLTGTGEIANSPVEHGAVDWCGMADVGVERTPDGLAGSTGGIVHVVPTHRSGLIAVDAVGTGVDDRVGIAFRLQDHRNYWSVEVDRFGGRLCAVVDAERTVVANDPTIRLGSPEHTLLQVSDDGQQISAHLGATPIVSAHRDGRLGSAVGVGLLIAGATARLSRFEAHPQTIGLPPELAIRDLASPAGVVVAIEDDFSGPPGDLHGREVRPGVVWRREVGPGRISTTGDGFAGVQASREAPNPGRTIYLVPCVHSGVVDVEVEITPPGTSRGQTHRGRGGVALWQDADHFVIVNNWLDDTYPGASLSMFCRLGRFEDIFRAVWSNVGQRIDWGVPHRLRVSFDGETLVARIDGAIVLYRSISDFHADAEPLKLSAVGLVANWEWGHDTGSTFHEFVARCDPV